MNIRCHSVLLASACLVVSALFVAGAPAREAPRAGHERAIRTSFTDAVMCVEEPVNPPPCAVAKTAAR